MKRRRSASLLRCATLALLVAAPVTTVESTAVCSLDETEVVVALMGVVLMNRNCLGVADNKCPVDTKCLSVLEHMTLKMPDCTAGANLGPSQRVRLQKLLDKCGPATPKPTSARTATTDATAQAAAKAAVTGAASRSDDTDSSSFAGETSTRSVASSPSTRIAHSCATGIVICAVVAANW